MNTSENIEANVSVNKQFWLSKHIDTIVILGAFASSFLWMNGKFNQLEKEITIIKTVLILKQIMPAELAVKTDNTGKNP